MKLDTLSENLILIVNKTLENQDLVKMVYYNVTSPLSQPVVENPKTLFMNKVFPYQYTGVATKEVETQLMIYYGNTDIDHIESTPVIFDVVLHKDLYLMKGLDNKSLLRPYEICNRITKQFDGVSIGTVGRLNFKTAFPFGLDSQPDYKMLRLLAKMMTIGG